MQLEFETKKALLQLSQETEGCTAHTYRKAVWEGSVA